MRIKLNLFTLTNQPRQIYYKWSQKQEFRWMGSTFDSKKPGYN